MTSLASRSLAGLGRRGLSRPVAFVSAALLALALIAGTITVVRFGEQTATEADGRLDQHAQTEARDLASLFSVASKDLRLARQNSTFDAALAKGNGRVGPKNRRLIEASITYVAER